jgi:hypothetical protein
VGRLEQPWRGLRYRLVSADRLSGIENVDPSKLIGKTLVVRQTVN